MTGQKKEILIRKDSRHSRRPKVFNFLPTAHFLETIASRTNGTFAFAPTHEANPTAKSKEPFLANALRIIYTLRFRV